MEKLYTDTHTHTHNQEEDRFMPNILPLNYDIAVVSELV